LNILYIGNSLFNNATGGEISIKLLIDRLSLCHHIVAICLGKEGKDTIKKNIHYRMERLPKILEQKFFPYHLKGYLADVYFQKKIKNLLKSYSPNIVICQCVSFDPAILSKKAKSIFFIRSCEDYSLREGWYGPFGRIHKLYNNIFFRMRNNRGNKVLNHANLLIANSFFLKEYLKKLDIKSEVIYPFIKLDYYINRNNKNYQLSEKKYISFINPIFKKGVEIALRITKKMPERNFLFIGKSANIPTKILKEIHELQNIKFIEWVQDMRSVYQQTSVVIMPSIWEEAFGRIPIEAGINGIPTIASNRGGLSESVGKGGILIDDPYDINAWITAIDRIESNRSTFSNSAMYHAEKFSFEKNFSDFKKIVKNRLDLEL